MATLSLKDCRDPWVLLATAFGSGLSPVAPGTVGSLLALPLWWFLLAPLSPLVQALVVLGSIAVCVLIVNEVCRRKEVTDDQSIVLDEVVGMWVALWAAPRSLVVAGVAFALFRLFDVWKPWPVSWAERELAGGLGVVMDDVVAGVLAAGVLALSLVIVDSSGVRVGA